MANWSNYFTPSQAQRELGLFCLGAGEQENPPGATPERALGCHALVLVRHGRGQLLHGADRVLHEVEAPALLWLFPGVLHGYRPSTRWQQSWTLFGGSAADALTSLGYLDTAHPVRRYAHSRAVERAFAKVIRVTRGGGRSTDLQAVAALYELIGVAAQDESAGDIVERLRGLACRPLSIQQYAEALGLSVHELRDGVRSAAGATPQEVILNTRLNTAKALLAETDSSVATIAHEVGYEDPAYFSRLFTSRVGQSPRAFRRIGSLAGSKSSF